jgi:hypothetical protein
MRIGTAVVVLYALFLSGAVGILFLVPLLGEGTVLLALVLFGLIWLIGNNFLRCPTCRKSVFDREILRFRFTLPIPETVCSRCGTQLIGESQPRDSD